MNKRTLSKAMSAQSGLSEAQCEKAIGALVAVVKAELLAGRVVGVNGFGQFKMRERARREGRDPRDGSKMIIQAGLVPKFLPAEQWKDEISGRVGRNAKKAPLQGVRERPEEAEGKGADFWELLAQSSTSPSRR